MSVLQNHKDHLEPATHHDFSVLSFKVPLPDSHRGGGNLYSLDFSSIVCSSTYFWFWIQHSYIPTYQAYYLTGDLVSKIHGLSSVLLRSYGKGITDCNLGVMVDPVNVEEWVMERDSCGILREESVGASRAWLTSSCFAYTLLQRFMERMMLLWVLQGNSPALEQWNFTHLSWSTQVLCVCLHSSLSLRSLMWLSELLSFWDSRIAVHSSGWPRAQAPFALISQVLGFSEYVVSTTDD